MTTEKKMCYIIDNGDTPITCELNSVMDMLEAESTDYNEDTNKQDKPQWTITLVWMTEEEYENLPEAY